MSPSLTTTWFTISPTDGRTTITPPWTDSTRELTVIPRRTGVMSASLSSAGWSTPGTLVIRLSDLVPSGHPPDVLGSGPRRGDASCGLEPDDAARLRRAAQRTR